MEGIFWGTQVPVKVVCFCQLRNMEHSWIFIVFLGLIKAIKQGEFLEAMRWGPACAEIKIICRTLWWSRDLLG